MPATMSPQEFVAKWKHTTGHERQAAQEHFIDLCHLIGHPTPTEADPSGTWFAFEAGADKQSGGQGWADVWKKGCFAWEYKGPHGDLDKAYKQLLQYRESLENPPLLIVSDLAEIRIHTNFTNTVKQIYRVTLDDLLKPEGLARLRAVFTDPDSFKAPQTTEQVTKDAAAEFARLAQLLFRWGNGPQAIAHFLIRILFCLFAEDAGLLPEGLFRRLLESARGRPEAFRQQLVPLFQAMTAGGFFGADEILHFDGGLFDSATVLDMDSDALDILTRAARLDWSSIEPAIFGTLFERSLDPSKRSQLGAHYTSREDILLIVEPVLMTPLRRRWAEVQQQALALAARREAVQGAGRQQTAQRQKLDGEIFALLRAFRHELARLRVLDPACGSGNFLYLALRQLLDLEKEVINLAGSLGDTAALPAVSPEQLHGIEISAYAHELAQTTIWIGYIQWRRENGFAAPPEPILKPIENVLLMDAILAHDAEGRPVEPVWPEADVIIGNPPFLGDKKMRGELGDAYVDDLRTLYAGRVPGGADLVTFWFEKARALIAAGRSKRAGLLATNSIRQQGNRQVLERVKESGDIFMAWSDRPWILDGAAIRVSMVGFGNGTETTRSLDGKGVASINANLTASVDMTRARPLPENRGIAFVGDTKKGAFDIPARLAEQMLAAPVNPNGRPNSDVLKRYANAFDVMQGSRGFWIIDFGLHMPEEEAALYELPYAHVRQHVKPERDVVRNAAERRTWWLHARPAPDLREAVKDLPRYIVTPQVAKHRVFAFLSPGTLPAHKLVAFARADDCFLGLLHSKAHELWSLRMCSWQGVGNDPVHTPTTTFATFPFPWAPGSEPTGDREPRVKAIADAAHDLIAKRDAWLNPPGAGADELKKRTLTNLYNQRPTWLELAHKRLDEAVLEAYGWPHDLPDEEILERLLALNLQRAGKPGSAEKERADSGQDGPIEDNSVTRRTVRR